MTAPPSSEIYPLVRQVDRVGRMADTAGVLQRRPARSRFHPDLIAQLKTARPIGDRGRPATPWSSSISLYRAPHDALNIYLDKASDEQIEDAVREYGQAISELAIANIFPGDMLWKNFGVTRYGRVVFCDYDEIEYMTDCNFRRFPPAPNERNVQRTLVFGGAETFSRIIPSRLATAVQFARRS